MAGPSRDASAGSDSRAPCRSPSPADRNWSSARSGACRCAAWRVCRAAPRPPRRGCLPTEPSGRPGSDDPAGGERPSGSSFMRPTRRRPCRAAFSPWNVRTCLATCVRQSPWSVSSCAVAAVAVRRPWPPVRPRRSRASARLRSCVRNRFASITITPSLVARWPASEIVRVRTLSERPWALAASKRSWTAVATLLTFWPPGPDERMKLSEMSPGKITASGATKMDSSAVMRPDVARKREKEKGRDAPRSPVLRSWCRYSAASSARGAAPSTEASTWLSNLAKLSTNMPTSRLAWRS
jgi:hypothetical protein